MAIRVRIIGPRIHCPADDVAIVGCHTEFTGPKDSHDGHDERRDGHDVFARHCHVVCERPGQVTDVR